MIAWLSKQRNPYIKGIAIYVFRRLYRLKSDEYLTLKATNYATFGDFFARPINPKARPMPASSSIVVAPCDGQLVDHCKIEKNLSLTIKGVNISIAELIGGNVDPALQGGSCTVHYLAPKDYHRVHMPYSAELRDITWLAGKHAIVKPKPDIAKTYLRNERVVLRFSTLQGPMALVFVAARNVGNIAIRDTGLVQGQQSPQQWRTESPKTYQRGEEIGRFLLGSTIVFLWPKTTARIYRLKPELSVGQHLKVLSPLLVPNV